MKIPFSPPYIDDLVRNEVNEVLDSGWITTGPKTKELEDMICKAYSIPACLAVNSWTSGATMLFKWWGLQPDDEVIIPSYTYAATALAVLHAGAIPVLVDVNESFIIDVEEIRKAITPRTKVIMPVDIGGLTADYNAIMSMVKENSILKLFSGNSQKQIDLGRILVVADAAHSIGATSDGFYSGTLCDITIFSLHAVKNITSAEGGLICLNLPEPFDNVALYPLLRRYSLNGQTKDAFTKTQAGGWKYDIVEMGMKCNLADLNAAVALGQFKQYDILLNERKRVHQQYDNAFKGLEWAITPSHPANKTSSYHIYLLRINGSEEVRDAIIQHSAERGVALNVHFRPLPELALFKELGLKVLKYDTAMSLFKQEISLPIYPQLSTEDVEYVIETIKEAYLLAQL